MNSVGTLFIGGKSLTIIKEQVKAYVSKILPKIEKAVNKQLEVEVLTRSSNSSKTSYAVAASLSELELKKILIEKIVSNKSIHIFDEQKNLYKALVDAYECDKLILETYGDTITLKRRRDDEDKDEELSVGSNRGLREDELEKTRVNQCTKGKDLQDNWQKQAKPPTPNRAWNKTLPATHGPIQPWINNLARKDDSRTLFNELMDTPLDFSACVMNQLKVDTLTPKLLAGPTYKLMKGSCKSLVELEFFHEEVYKATTDQLDWNNPEGQQYPHDLRKLLSLIPTSWGHCVIPFDHFINNDLEYLRGGVSSRKYTTSVTKTKAVDYRHINGLMIWYLVQCRVKYRIITITELQIVEWHNYKHLDWITVCRDDDKLYKFKEGVESYQKKLNLTKLDMYRSDLKRKEAYTTYSNPRGSIYQNKDKQNRLIRIDELYKFSDSTLNDVRTALDDHLKEIRMQYLLHTI
uniref:Uncharacterized protein n=1 Tax=Tanacetum cinerariifolium TaxID=118510 RepID=A0A6L2P2A8_TANCI|nr:hypothetical protein [Tanacetum cinerariifolium]